MLLEGEPVPADEVAARAGPPDRQTAGRLFLRADADGALVVLKDLLELVLLLAARRVDAVEALSVLARVVVNFQLIGAGDLQLVRNLSSRRAVLDGLVGFQVFVRQLKAV